MTLPQPTESVFRAYFATPNSSPLKRSVLYMLRRDAVQCFGFNPDTYEVTQSRPSDKYPTALWPGAMTICTGIDLLGKFMAGVDEDDQKPSHINRTHPDYWRYSVGGRFREFAQRYLATTNAESEVLYQARCAIAHSFSLWARKRDDGQEYSFTFDRLNGTTLLMMRTNSVNTIEAIIYLDQLQRRFEQASVNFASDYYSQLESSTSVQTKFMDFVNHYGFVGVAHASTFGW